MKFDITGELSTEFTLLDVEADDAKQAIEIAKERVRKGENHNLCPMVIVDFIHCEQADSEK